MSTRPKNICGYVSTVTKKGDSPPQLHKFVKLNLLEYVQYWDIIDRHININK